MNYGTEYTKQKTQTKAAVKQGFIGIAAVLLLIYISFPGDKEDEKEATGLVELKATEEEARREREWLEQNAQSRAIAMQRTASEERERALSEWDAAIRNETDERRERLRKASKSHETRISGGNRYDNYVLNDGRVIVCRTKVSDSGTFMDCDGDV